MKPWYVHPLAYLFGILFNLNPSCGKRSKCSCWHRSDFFDFFMDERLTLTNL